jgi:hypothetical protein
MDGRTDEDQSTSEWMDNTGAKRGQKNKGQNRKHLLNKKVVGCGEESIEHRH